VDAGRESEPGPPPLHEAPPARRRPRPARGVAGTIAWPDQSRAGPVLGAEAGGEQVSPREKGRPTRAHASRRALALPYSARRRGTVGCKEPESCASPDLSLCTTHHSIHPQLSPCLRSLAGSCTPHRFFVNEDSSQTVSSQTVSQSAKQFDCCRRHCHLQRQCVESCDTDRVTQRVDTIVDA
jgi:hypothetical protein